MCGIVGKLYYDQERPVESSKLDAMCQSLVHRGPDADGSYLKGNVGLAMRRLSIIDLQTGTQPIHNEDRTIWIVCNGEIYNFPDLRRELQAKGHRFYTRTDTEVIVHLIYQNGFEPPEFKMGYASALAIVLFGIIFVFTLLQFKFFQRRQTW